MKYRNIIHYCHIQPLQIMIQDSGYVTHLLTSKTPTNTSEESRSGKGPQKRTIPRRTASSCVKHTLWPTENSAGGEGSGPDSAARDRMLMGLGPWPLLDGVWLGWCVERSRSPELEVCDSRGTMSSLAARMRPQASGQVNNWWPL